MPERPAYKPLEDNAVVFRQASVLGTFLPQGAVLPLITWLEPSTQDKAESDKVGRTVGISAWNRALTTPQQALAFRGSQEGGCKSFWAQVGALRHEGQKHGRQVEVLEDPLDDPRPGAAGHCRIEGFQRPSGGPKLAHKTFLEAVVQLFAEE